MQPPAPSGGSAGPSDLTGGNRRSNTSPPHGGDAVSDAAALVHAARKAALATLDRETGYPYASLVTIAIAPDGTPVMLLSALARHTRNLASDPRSSLLFEPAGTMPLDPLSGARVTVIGSLSPLGRSPSEYGSTLAHFLSVHEEARGYAEFADFRLFAMTIVAAHFIGGFGRIVEIEGAELRAKLALGQAGHGTMA